MRILEKGSYAIGTKTVLATSDEGVSSKDLPIWGGLHILRRCGSDGWYVIASVDYDPHEEGCSVSGVGTRLCDVGEEDWRIVRKLLSTAASIVEAANMDEDGE